MSKMCELEVRRDGNVYIQTYTRGVPNGPLEMVGKTRGRGQKLHFYRTMKYLRIPNLVLILFLTVYGN